MQKVARGIQIIHQLCLAHGMQLAVIKILYNNNTFADSVEEHINEETQYILDSDAEEEEDEYEFAEGFNILSTSIINSSGSETNQIRYTDLAPLV